MNKIFKNPYLNSVYAEAYIVTVALVIRYAGQPDTPDNFFTPIAVLSLFVLSAAVMGYLFLGEPFRIFFEGERERALSFFLKTAVSFAAITAAVFLVASRLF